MVKPGSNMPPVDSELNDRIEQVIGNKGDTADSTADTASLVALVRQVLADVSTVDGVADDVETKVDTVDTNVDTLITANNNVTVVSNTGVAIAGNGENQADLFTVTGGVHIYELWAEVTDATDTTTLETASFILDDATTTADITESSTGTDLSGVAAGSIVKCDAAPGTAVTLVSNAVGAVDAGALA